LLDEMRQFPFNWPQILPAICPPSPVYVSTHQTDLNLLPMMNNEEFKEGLIEN
jgi:hypothetical protein